MTKSAEWRISSYINSKFQSILMSIEDLADIFKYKKDKNLVYTAREKVEAAEKYLYHLMDRAKNPNNLKEGWKP